MNDKSKDEAPPTLPEGTVIYRPDKEVYKRLHLCIYMRELLDNPPFGAETADPENDRNE